MAGDALNAPTEPGFVVVRAALAGIALLWQNPAPSPASRGRVGKLSGNDHPENDQTIELMVGITTTFADVLEGRAGQRIEVALFDAAPKTRGRKGNGFYSEDADPLTTFDLKRFNAVRGYQAQQGREISRCLKELRALRKDALAEGTDEPEEDAAKQTREPAHVRQRRRDRRIRRAFRRDYRGGAKRTRERRTGPGQPSKAAGAGGPARIWGQPQPWPAGAGRSATGGAALAVGPAELAALGRVG